MRNVIVLAVAVTTAVTGVRGLVKQYREGKAETAALIEKFELEQEQHRLDAIMSTLSHEEWIRQFDREWEEQDRVHAENMARLDMEGMHLDAIFDNNMFDMGMFNMMGDV